MLANADAAKTRPHSLLKCWICNLAFQLKRSGHSSAVNLRRAVWEWLLGWLWCATLLWYCRPTVDTRRVEDCLWMAEIFCCVNANFQIPQRK